MCEKIIKLFWFGDIFNYFLLIYLRELSYFKNGFCPDKLSWILKSVESIKLWPFSGKNLVQNGKFQITCLIRGPYLPHQGSLPASSGVLINKKYNWHWLFAFNHKISSIDGKSLEITFILALKTKVFRLNCRWIIYFVLDLVQWT